MISSTLGRLAEIVAPEDRMRSRNWRCSTCRTATTTAEPVPFPGPCAKCSGIFFETIDGRVDLILSEDTGRSAVRTSLSYEVRGSWHSYSEIPQMPVDAAVCTGRRLPFMAHLLPRFVRIVSGESKEVRCQGDRISRI